MTITEALEILRDPTLLRPGYEYNKQKEALDMAIDALSDDMPVIEWLDVEVPETDD